MKGMVFVELTDFLEDQFGFELVDDLITAANLPSGGAYTRVGTYPHTEVVTLVSALAEHLQANPSDLYRAFGQHLFGRLAGSHPKFMEGAKDPLEFLRTVHAHIHVQVRKLYPDAELPEFTYDAGEDPNTVVMEYRSARGFADLAEGLIHGCLAWFESQGSVERSDQTADGKTRLLHDSASRGFRGGLMDPRFARRLARERAAREAAENLLESKSAELYEANQALEGLAADLERRVEARTQELTDTARALAHASQAKSEFLARMSHELRTPLNGVLGLVLLAQDRVAEGPVASLLERASQSAQSLLEIIGEVLDFSKIEAGRLELEDTAFTLSEVLECLPALQTTAQSDAVELFIRVRPDVPARLSGDPLRLRQVLVNLVGNAFKYTESGHVLVEISCHENGARGVHLGFSVTDTGPGFDPALAEQLFDAFTQADESVTRTHGGTGLGLAISKGFVEAMGGGHLCQRDCGRGGLVYLRCVVWRPGRL